MSIKKGRKILLFFLLFILSLGVLVNNGSSEREYIFIIICITLLIATKPRMKCHLSQVSMICLMMFVIYLYGLVVGLIRGNVMGFILRDHGGMFLYIFILALQLFSDDYKETAHIIYSVALVTLMVQIIYDVALALSPSLYSKLPFSDYIYLQSSGCRMVVMLSGKNLIIVIACVALYNILQGRRLLRSIIMFTCVGVVEALMPTDASKISFLFSVGCLMIAFMMSKKTINKHIVAIMICLVALIMLCIILPYIIDIFSSNDTGNSIRIGQIKYVLSHFSLWGYGHGADYSAIDRDYMIEVAWMDIIYKYGIMSIVPYAVYFYSIVFSIKGVKTYFSENREDYTAAVSIGLMSYLMGGLSNPILFAPLNVVSHMLSLVISDASLKGVMKGHE